ncbi:MAG: valine--tRNA ligase [Saprospiraceae bacterium]|nr:valine--tRNA ligase [Saprospiraceae bacterium]
MTIASRYSPSDIETKWYQYWLDKNYFHSTPDNREAFSIVIPPPNVTGVLHMGHMLNNTIQDILIRKARQDGKNACWVPGTDHASIATEAKVVKMLREKGIKKSDLTRDEFLKYAWEWKEEYGGIILQQLQKLGASCDWERTAFTMDKVRSEAVIEVFIDLYQKGKLYRGKRMVNWDPEAKTVLSNEEVIYGLEQSKIYFVNYKVEGTEEVITIATTRPETIMGDTAVAVHPEDPRYTHLHGKNAIVPVIGRAVPIIADTYVDMEFGTGALKVTPAHDINDYEIGKRHDLAVIDVFNEDGTMSSDAGIYIGEDRFLVRKKFAKDLEADGHILKVEDYQNNVGRSERTNCVVEPRLSLQWYVDMQSLAEPALNAVMQDVIEFFPKTQKNTYKHWMENIRDWCISRQLWWGHRIPAWYYGDQVFVAKTAEEALHQAKEATGNEHLSIKDLREDDDVLDTWFSSWLWPISVFDGFRSKDELNYYYPTSVLVTGWDIIFLWVARMAMAGYEWEGQKPFHHVYFTGMVRDKQRRKMSKQLGNSPDALKLIEEFGADGVRFGMMSCSPAGGDLLFDEKLCEQGRNFCNKIWNALRLVQGWETSGDVPYTESDRLAFRWMEQKINQLASEIERNFKEYRLSEAQMNIYNFVWNDYCSWYLEIIKPDFETKMSSNAKSDSIELFKKICSLLHPFMPFITEEIWDVLHEGNKKSDCILSEYPKPAAFDNHLIQQIDQAKDIITNIRDIRNKNGIKMKELLSLAVLSSDRSVDLLNLNGLKEMIMKLGNLSEINFTNNENEDGIAFISGTEKFFVGVKTEIDIDGQISEKQVELNYQKGFVNSINMKLQNEKFVSGAPEDVVDKERKKLADGNERIKMLTDDIERLERLKK